MPIKPWEDGLPACLQHGLEARATRDSMTELGWQNSLGLAIRDHDQTRGAEFCLHGVAEGSFSPYHYLSSWTSEQVTRLRQTRKVAWNLSSAALHPAMSTGLRRRYANLEVLVGYSPGLKQEFHRCVQRRTASLWLATQTRRQSRRRGGGHAVSLHHGNGTSTPLHLVRRRTGAVVLLSNTRVSVGLAGRTARARGSHR